MVDNTPPPGAEHEQDGIDCGCPLEARAEQLSNQVLMLWDELRLAVLAYVELWNQASDGTTPDEILQPCGGVFVAMRELIADCVVSDVRPVSPWGLEKMRMLAASHRSTEPEP